MSNSVEDWIRAAQLGIQAAQTIGSSLDVPAARNFSREMYQRQVEDNRLNWQIQNAYNTPSMQMSRLKLAGLNPHLLMSPNGASIGLSGNMAQSAGATSPSFAPVGNNPSVSYDTPASEELMRAQTEEIRSRIPVHEREVLEKDRQVKKLDSDIEVNRKSMESISATIKDTEAQEEMHRATASLQSFQEYLLWYMAPIEKHLKEAEIAKMNADAKEALANASYMSANKKLVEATIKEVEQRVANNEAVFQSTFGSNPEAVSNNIKSRFELATKQLEVMYKTAAWRAGDTYQRIQMTMDCLKPITEVFNLLSGTGSVYKTASNFDKL